jgi:nucleotide-binding universal stress UspA family protein
MAAPCPKRLWPAALNLAKLGGAELVALKVVPRYPQSYFEGGLVLPASEVAKVDNGPHHGQAVVDAVAKAAKAKGVTAKGLVAKSDLVSEAIIATARKNKCDLIVMASHGRRGRQSVFCWAAKHSRC